MILIKNLRARMIEIKVEQANNERMHEQKDTIYKMFTLFLSPSLSLSILSYAFGTWGILGTKPGRVQNDSGSRWLEVNAGQKGC